jgi:transglutaminase-like putative cysteine protease
VRWADTDSAPSPLSALGRRIGATAIGVGVVVPMLIPGLHGGLPKHGGNNGDGNGNGSSQVVTLNPIVNIRAQLTSPKATPVIHYTSTDPSPLYLRLTSLDRFDGTTFAPSTLVASAQARVSKGIKAPPVTGTSVQTNLDVSNLSVHWLPLPSQIEDVKTKGDWRYDPGSNTVFSAKADTKNLSISASSIRYEPTASELDAAGFVAHNDVPSAYLELPSTLSPQVIALAESITSKAASPFSKALAIQNYLTGPTFHYDTTVAGSDSTDALEQFLLVSKRGFCQQFSASMAVLARIVQIPARVAVGFTHGVHQPDGSWLVTTHDAHAWPELFFSGFGWLPFEPTPRNDGQAITPVFARTNSSGEPSDVGPKTPDPKPSTAPSLSAADRKQLDKPTPPATLPVAKPKHTHRSWWWLVPAVLALLLPVPGLARAIERRRRWKLAGTGAQKAHAAWSELRASAIDAGIDWVDGLTPRASARLLSAEHGVDGSAAREALSRVVRAEERARYAAVPDASAGEELRADVSTVSHALTADQAWLRHAMSVVAPRSTLSSARRMFGVLADGLDFLDAAGARLRARVQPPRWSS